MFLRHLFPTFVVIVLLSSDGFLPAQSADCVLNTDENQECDTHCTGPRRDCTHYGRMRARDLRHQVHFTLCPATPSPTPAPSRRTWTQRIANRFSKSRGSREPRVRTPVIGRETEPEEQRRRSYRCKVVTGWMMTSNTECGEGNALVLDDDIIKAQPQRFTLLRVTQWLNEQCQQYDFDEHTKHCPHFNGRKAQIVKVPGQGDRDFFYQGLGQYGRQDLQVKVRVCVHDPLLTEEQVKGMFPGAFGDDKAAHEEYLDDLAHDIYEYEEDELRYEEAVVGLEEAVQLREMHRRKRQRKGYYY